ncbi:MAG: ABC transporter permease subunit [Proteobacteria bacterium]|nr:ABC transporter permease subunit [Pseudomonadota bacterium]
MSASLPRRLARALLEAAFTLWLLASLCFVLLHAAPGGPFDTEKAAPPEVQAALAAQYRLDQPLPSQYLHWLGDLAHGNLGPSFQYPDYRVSELIALALPVTALCGGIALLLALGLGIPLGLMAALRRGSRMDRLLMGVTGLGLAVPKFVVAPLLVLVFAVAMHWLPGGGWDRSTAWTILRSATLPAIALALPNLAWCARIARAGFIEALGSDYVRAARGRGFSSSRIILVHALAPALLPVLAWLGPALINIVSGSAVVEQVFGIPGMGRYFVQGALNRDYTLVMGVVLVVGVLIVAINAITDALRAWLDPRLRPA